MAEVLQEAQVDQDVGQGVEVGDRSSVAQVRALDTFYEGRFVKFLACRQHESYASAETVASGNGFEVD